MSRPDNVAPLRSDPVVAPELLTPELAPDPTPGDLDRIEDGILSGLEVEPPFQSPPPAEPGQPGRPARKEKLINDIEALRGACPDIIPTLNRLKKTKVADLEIILARAVSAASGHSLRPGVPPTAPEPPRERLPPPPLPGSGAAPQFAPRVSLDAPGLNGRNIAKTLCDLNILAFEVGEFATQIAAPYTGGIIVSGGALELRARENELEDVLRRIYADNKEVLDRYVSPTFAWASLMATVAIKNVKKIDEVTGEILDPRAISRPVSRAPPSAGPSPTQSPPQPAPQSSA